MVQDDLKRLNEETKKQKEMLAGADAILAAKEKEIAKILHENEILKKRIVQLKREKQKYYEFIKQIMNDSSNISGEKTR